MSGTLIGALLFLLMTVMILSGIPLAVSMMSCSFLGFYLIGGLNVAATQFTNAFYTLAADYNFAVIPLFMVMGQLCGDTGIAAGAYSAAKKWLNNVKGGLLDTTIVANAIFGACSGVSAAGNVVFSKIALPELDKNHYDHGLSLATITAAGSLAVLIPPSMPIITFCLLTSVSVGAALMTGLACGVMMVIIYIVFLKIYGVVRPSTIPPRENVKIPMMEKVKTLKLLLPILLLFALIVGGCFAGWFPATVGGAVGFVAVLIYAFASHMPPKRIAANIWAGLKGFGSMYMIICSGQMFGRVVTMSGLAASIANFIGKLDIAPFFVFLMVVLFYTFCGMFMDCLSIIIITVPIVYPILTGLGYHPLILVMLLVFTMEVANLTPPVGLSVFYVANCTHESPSFIFKHVAKFFVLDIVIILLLALFPDLVLWLPRLLGYA